jgi:hypothetical protein
MRTKISKVRLSNKLVATVYPSTHKMFAPIKTFQLGENHYTLSDYSNLVLKLKLNKQDLLVVLNLNISDVALIRRILKTEDLRALLLHVLFFVVVGEWKMIHPASRRGAIMLEAVNEGIDPNVFAVLAAEIKGHEGYY